MTVKMDNASSPLRCMRPSGVDRVCLEIIVVDSFLLFRFGILYPCYRVANV